MEAVIRPFADSGHYTETPNAVFDVLMPILSGNAMKILFFVLRQTRGWGKEQEELSYSQIMAGTGIKTDNTVTSALRELTSDELFGSPILLAEEGPKIGATSRIPTIYSLNPEFSLPASDGVKIQPHGVKIQPSPRRKNSAARRKNYAVDGVKIQPCDGVKITPSIKDEENKETKEEERVARASPPPGSFFRESQNQPQVPPRAPPETSKGAAPQAMEQLGAGRHEPFISGADDPRFQTEHFQVLCEICQVDLQVISYREKEKLAMHAVQLFDGGYSVADLQTAAKRWPFASAPIASQFCLRIRALLNQKLESSKADSDGKNQRSPAATGYRSAAERRADVWGEWVDDLQTTH